MLYLLSLHYPEERIMVCVNRFFYEEYYVEPITVGSNAKRTMECLEKMLWDSMKFISKYFKACCQDLTVYGPFLDELVKEIFPDLIPYLVNLRCLRDLHKVESVTSKICLQDLSIHLDALLPTDWISLYHTAELDEHRRGLSIR